MVNLLLILHKTDSWCTGGLENLAPGNIVKRVEYKSPVLHVVNGIF